LRRIDGGESAASANAKSILSVLMLAATRGTQLHASSEGIDEERAMEAIESLFAEGFEETLPGSSK
jgi:phosphocarrier protein HPr